MAVAAHRLLIRTLLATTFLLILEGSLVNANAACAYDSRGPQVLTYNPPSTISVPRDLPVGSVFATAQVTETHAGGIWCNNGTYSISFVNNNPNATSSSSTSIESRDSVINIPQAGWGYRLIRIYEGTHAINTSSPYDIVVNISTPGSFCPIRTRGCAGLFTSVSGRIEFVKTSTNVRSYTLAAQRLATAVVDSKNFTYLQLGRPVTVVPQTCTVNTPSLTVPLTPEGGLPRSTFTGVGSTSAPVNFSLGLNCSGVAATIGVTFTDVRNPGNTGNTLPLTASSTASGLGVQILRNGSPVGFGPDSSAAGNTNQIMLTRTDGSTGALSFQFAARYVQTAPSVEPGSANATATVTFSYQ